MLLYLPAVVTLLTVLLLLGNTYAVGAARKKYDIKAPAVTGHPVFERAYRVQMNTLENTVMFLPALWLAATYGYAVWSGLLGLIWIVGRVWYSLAYLQDASKRGPGFGLALAAWAVILVLAIIGVIHTMMLSATIQ